MSRVTRPHGLTPADLTGNAALVVGYYDALFNRGDLDVVDRLVDPSFVQHNPSAPDGPEALKAGARFLRQIYPQARIEFVRTLAEGDLVAVHTHFTTAPGDPGTATIDIFRVVDSRIVVHWDVIREVSATPVGGRDEFSTATEPAVAQPDPAEPGEANGVLVRTFFDDLFVRHDVSAFDRFVDPVYVQHDPTVEDGIPASRDPLGMTFELFPDLVADVRRTIADGDYVLVHSHVVTGPGDRGRAAIDIFRVRDGRIVEHWDVVQDVPATAANANGMV